VKVSEKRFEKIIPIENGDLALLYMISRAVEDTAKEVKSSIHFGILFKDESRTPVSHCPAVIY
jgi:hypothetical protein